jgi:hypothetical protein
VRVGIEIASALVRLYPAQFEAAKAERLVGSRATLASVRSGTDPRRIAAGWAGDEARWRLLRAKYLLYR